jgi:hypothetical protein
MLYFFDEYIYFIKKRKRKAKPRKRPIPATKGCPTDYIMGQKNWHFSS